MTAYVFARGERLSDELEVAKTAGTMLGSAGLVGALMRWLAGREAREAREAQEKARVEFVLLRADVKRLIDDVGEHKAVFADVVTTKNAVDALGKKLDEQRSSIAELYSENKALRDRMLTIEQKRHGSGK
jgi:hypothetical protein